MRSFKKAAVFLFLATLTVCGVNAGNWDDSSDGRESDEFADVSSKQPYSPEIDSQQDQQGEPVATEAVKKKQKMRLFLRELAILKKAAKAAGGDLKVSIQPVGISSGELVDSLARLDWFDISPGDDAVMIRSREEDPYVFQMREEVGKLEQKRNALMKDVKELESLLVQGENRLRSMHDAMVTQQQGGVFQDKGVVRPQASVQGGVMSVPSTFPGQRIPDQNAPQGASTPQRQEADDEIEVEEGGAPFSPRSTVMLAPSTKGVKTK